MQIELKHPDVGRGLRVSELEPETLVVLQKEGQDAAITVWVVEVGEEFVQFRAGKTRMDFFAERCGPDLEQITDDVCTPLKVFEYLGEA